MRRRLFNLLVTVAFLLGIGISMLWLRRHHRFIVKDIPQWAQTEPVWEGFSTPAQKRAAWEKSQDRTVDAYALDRTFPEVTFDGPRLDETIDFLRDTTGARIIMNWDAIEAAGIPRDRPIFLKFRNEWMSTGLARVLESAGLAYVFDGSEIHVSTRKDLRARLGGKHDRAVLDRGGFSWPASRMLDNAAIRRHRATPAARKTRAMRVVRL
ncbi:MAG TPA: hypothetical protein VFE47_28385 [Tepidisphaeraceae bacterium]|nr:hypothetical protein [Tepidisphaeraceae bacterium]